MGVDLPRKWSGDVHLIEGKPLQKQRTMEIAAEVLEAFRVRKILGQGDVSRENPASKQRVDTAATICR